MKEQIIKKPTINDYPSTDERTFVELDGKVNWEKYAKALDEFIVKLIQCKNIIAKVKKANTLIKGKKNCDNCIWGKCLTADWPCFDCDGSNKWEPIK